MSSGLSEDDMERIRLFVETPAYKRRPELLLPDDAEPEAHLEGDDAEDEAA